MKRMILILSILVLTGIVLSACGQAAPAPTPTQSQKDEVAVVESSYINITLAELKTMLENKDFFLVNVHIPYEGEIPQTDIFAPYDEIEQYLPEFAYDTGVKIVLYCRYDSMSVYAAGTLVSLGFTDVYRLDGGFSEWERQDQEAGDVALSTGRPRIYFEEESADMGEIPTNSPRSYTFRFKNVGDGPLEIRDVQVVALEGC